MSTREAFLERVRQAVLEGNRAGATPPLPERGRIAYQGGGDNTLERFCTELRSAGGQPFLAPTPAAAWDYISGVLRAHQVRKILLGQGGALDDLGLAGTLASAGFELIRVGDVVAAWREPYFAADAGISNVSHLIAETGTVVMATAAREPRSLSLLPPLHLAVARREQILPDLFDLFDLFAERGAPAAPPSCLTLITGPSKTGDIELKLVTGVHGPGELHVVLV